MTRSTFSILFFIKKSKTLSNGNVPIFVRITINGERSEFSLKRDIPIKRWDNVRHCSNGRSEADKQLNTYLQKIQAQLYQHHQDLIDVNHIVSAKMLADRFLGKDESRTSLIQLFEEHNSRIENLVGKEYSPLTLQRYNAALKHLKKFLAYNRIASDYPIKLINNKFITDFEYYLKNQGQCQHNTVMKHLKALKKVTRIALAQNLLKANPFEGFKIREKIVERECLTIEEIQQLIDKNFSTDRLEKVRDIFVFQCLSGIAYQDVAALSINDLHIDQDGNDWIYLKRGKSKTIAHIPLLPLAKRIVNKYNEHPSRIDRKSVV